NIMRVGGEAMNQTVEAIKNISLRVTMPMRALLISLVILFSAASVVGQSALEKHDVHSLALLPVIGEVVPETVRDLLAGELSTQLEKQFSKVRIKNVADSVSALKQAGQLNDLGNLANLYTKVGVIDSDAAGRIARTLGVESVLMI